MGGLESGSGHSSESAKEKGMNALAIGAAAFVCVFGGALLGFWLRTVLPERHLSPDSRDLVRLGMGTIATMTALVLGLLVASAKSSYDAESRGLTEMAAKVILLDRILAHYGPEAQEARDLLKIVIAGTLERIWPKRGSPPQALAPTGSGADILYDKLEQLVPKNDVQRGLQSRALNIATDIAQTRLLMIEQAYSPVSSPLLVVVVFSLAVTFMSFGLHAPPNGTVVITFFLAALSVSAVMFLILGMYTPFGGFIPISSAPLRWALEHLGG
jgi:hypothetical protein